MTPLKARVKARIPLLGFAAPSGTGKTTLLRQVLSLLVKAGLRVGVVKQARDDFDVDVPGKDSYELRKAGVERLLLASERKSALMVEHPDTDDPQLEPLLGRFDQTRLDLILAEGFSDQPFPKIELYRQRPGAQLRYPDDPWIVAVATDTPGVARPPMIELDINQPTKVADFVIAFLLQRRRARPEELPGGGPNK